MPFNMVAPLECPSCGEYDKCANGCACPSCFLGAGEDRLDALDAWERHARLMLTMNNNEIDFDWSRDECGYHLSDILVQYNNSFEVRWCGSVFAIDQWTMDRPATFMTPAEWSIATVHVCEDEDAVVRFFLEEKANAAY